MPRAMCQHATKCRCLAAHALEHSYTWPLCGPTHPFSPPANCCLIADGISFALSSLGGSLMVSFMVSAAAELPSYIFAGWAIDRCAGGCEACLVTDSEGAAGGRGEGSVDR